MEGTLGDEAEVVKFINVHRRRRCSAKPLLPLLLLTGWGETKLLAQLPAGNTAV